MKYLLIITVVAFSFVGYGQNWDVFNPNYRYNYKYDNSGVVSNVIFAETVTATASQTSCITNTIGVLSGTLITADQPQFLKRNIIKLANGNFVLQDPSTLTIIPTCTVGQTWSFNANNSQTAICVSTFTQSIFNTIDSVKVIIVNNSDSLVLSRSFGIVQFPKYDLYVPNKYFRLVGIENKASYDPTPLYGEKVPNAWDFYNYYVGYSWCVYTESNPMGSSMYVNCSKSIQTIISKTVTSNSYNYNIDGVYINSLGFQMTGYCNSPSAPSTTSTNVNFVINGVGPLGLSSPSLIENSYYPGFLIAQGTSPNTYSIVRFGIDNTGRFYKYVGPSCSNSNLGVTLPNQNEPAGYSPSGPVIGVICGINHTWGVGIGKVSEKSGYCLSGFSTYCTTCFGTVGLTKNQIVRPNDVVFPNPANELLQLPVEYGVVKLFDPFGKLVKQEKLENKNTLDISEFTNGVYMIEIQADSFKFSQKLIIQH